MFLISPLAFSFIVPMDLSPTSIWSHTSLTSTDSPRNNYSPRSNCASAPMCFAKKFPLLLSLMFFSVELYIDCFAIDLRLEDLVSLMYSDPVTRKGKLFARIASAINLALLLLATKRTGTAMMIVRRLFAFFLITKLLDHE